MSWTKRILAATAAMVVLAVASFAFAISYDAPCPASSNSVQRAGTMQAFIARCYGAPDVLALVEVAKPLPANNEVLIEVRAISVNPADWHRLRGSPYFVRLPDGFGAPEDERIGGDIAGVVAAVGSDVKVFKPGDEVFGRAGGGFAEFAVALEDRVALKPANVSFEQAAAIPVAAITALQALRDRAQVQPGQKVLINGASGGVGTFAVQIAKVLGAEVTGVCSTRNVELVRSLGADHVIDYTREDFTRMAERYDVIIDNVGNHSLSDLRGSLEPSGELVVIGSASRDPWIKPVLGMIAVNVMARFVDQEMGFLMAKMKAADLEVLAGFVQDGKLTSVIDRRYPFNELPAALAYLEEGRARGKVVVNVEAVTLPSQTSRIR
jgi:NADPH:quinone reductase-like Zn-dependent oxidoreductase